MKTVRISSAVEDQDLNVIHGFLANESAWAKDIPRDVVQKSVENSLNFGLFLDDEQIAYARVISDFATFAYLLDVFVLLAHRGKDYSRVLMSTIVSDSRLQGLRRFVLITSTAHGLYEKYGFASLKKPDAFMEIALANAYQREE
jgi:GNAT superfamily N-acetyltransferase